MEIGGESSGTHVAGLGGGGGPLKPGLNSLFGSVMMGIGREGCHGGATPPVIDGIAFRGSGVVGVASVYVCLYREVSIG